MQRDTKFKSDSCEFFAKKTSVFVFLLLMVMLAFPFISMANSSSVAPPVVVGNETELLNALNEAPNKKSCVIGISENITLKKTLEIPKSKNIALIMSDSASIFVSLVGADGADTIVVKSGGTLTLESGVVVTHVEGEFGRGVYVERKGTLILSGGIISGNTVHNDGGGGVYNQGAFTMIGGKISNNTARDNSIYGDGGGVYNVGTFKMSDGVISGNNASGMGGGVYNWKEGIFVMYGGEITRNNASYGGGLFYFSGTVKGSFTLSGGKISGNTDTNGGGQSRDLGVLCVDGPFLGLHFLSFGLVIVGVVIVVGLFFYRSKS